MGNVMDCRPAAAAVKARVRAEAKELAEQGIKPKLDVILVGEDPASKTYVNGKERDCKEVGIISKVHRLPEETPQAQLLALIGKLNADTAVSGVLVQLPLPAHIDEKAVIAAIDSGKDVDAFSKESIGRLFLGEEGFAPCTPAGILELLEYYQISIKGKHCVIVGRSNIVGKPAALLMLRQNATVTVCHSATADLAAFTGTADILIAAAGREKIITANMVKDGAVVIDVGINRNAEGKLCGDVDFDGVIDRAAYVSPVPGGVGLMTRAVLMENTLRAAKLRARNA
ncbi:MAG: bifunctional 5,10-methylene-tetrahydrofolate dehydrogenase/5,10-methylene-tetrahydrofolate cyclohydrolase [Oscillospiraceae bacterium]|nr:bifunctional 5,10-methylene-tetrahydrofolate dehydrogenase/5,10-methylene-tetrahydrofolate cyclohydrolase [Oscillospiraceae bacterium]